MLHVPLKGPADVARAAAYTWAADVWETWGIHHETVRAWVDKSGLGSDA